MSSPVGVATWPRHCVPMIDLAYYRRQPICFLQTATGTNRFCEKEQFLTRTSAINLPRSETNFPDLSAHVRVNSRALCPDRPTSNERNVTIVFVLQSPLGRDKDPFIITQHQYGRPTTKRQRARSTFDSNRTQHMPLLQNVQCVCVFARSSSSMVFQRTMP
jgi:hypothetical protein